VADDLLQALRKEGIVALKNIPDYPALREEYLREAAKCALIAGQTKADFLFHKTLIDGTQRFTISTNSGSELATAAQETADLCPDYQQKYRRFSEVVENAIQTLGAALDTTAFTISGDDASTAFDLIKSSVHLDHFHAYQASEELSSAFNGKEDHRLSLEMHIDNGMMIAMTAPKYFDVVSASEVQEKHTKSEETGLLIETSDGSIVRPLLQDEELVIMIGHGFDQWINTSPRLRAVPHGMKYPKISFVGERLLRTWFGKMVLLAPHQRMLNTGMSFAEYADQTTRYLMQDEDHSTFASIACPTGRRLMGSDSKCVVRECKEKPGKKPEVPCSMQCNLNPKSRSGADVLCEENCDCTDLAGNATYCWMLCVFDLPQDKCELGQRCLTGTEAPYMVDQARICITNTTNGTAKVEETPSPTLPPASAASFCSVSIYLSFSAVLSGAYLLHLFSS
jgi:hypothetical protein